MSKNPSTERHTTAARRSLLARLILGVMLTAGVGSAQQRPPIDPLRHSIAHRVADIEPAQNRFPLEMSAAARLGDRTVAFIQSSDSPDSNTPFLWSVDDRTGRASLLAEVTPWYNVLYQPNPFARLGDRLYFVAGSSGITTEIFLWSTDGTRGGTAPLIAPDGSRFEYPALPTLFGGSLYFFASTGDLDVRFWKTDGTVKGTAAMPGVRGIPPDFVGFEGYTAVGLSQPPLTVVGGKPLFVALSDRDPGTRPYALYRLNDADSHPTFLQDFSGVPGPMVEVGGVGYFSATDTLLLRQRLWRTDGTPEGTRIVGDIDPGFLGSDADSVVVAGGTLYFSANDGVHGRELWKSDGTSAGTVLVGDIRNGSFSSSPHGFVAAGAQVFFLADDGERGQELWRTDGTAEGTRLVRDVRPGPDGSATAGLVPLGQWLLFSADDGTHGQELWRTDGTEAGTVMIADIAPGPAASAPRTMTASGGAVYFSADDGVHGRELWRTDGTPGGTSLAADLLPDAEGSDPFIVAGPLSSLSVLAVDSGGLSLRELISPTGEMVRLATLDSGKRSVSSNPSSLTDVGGRLCFFTNAGGYAETSRLWTSDGTEAGTSFLANVEPTSTVDGNQPNAVAPISLGGSLYFVGFTEGGSVNDKFYRFDLDMQNLEPLTDTYPFGRAVIEQTLYFTINFSELWKTDAASSAVVLVKKFDGSPVVLAASGGVLYISVAGASPGLWKSDGSESGTVPVWSGFAHRLADAAGSLFFTSYDYTTRLASLWVIAPGASSASLVRTFPLDPIYGDPSSDLTGAGSSLFFLVRDPDRNSRLWKSDGTGGGTLRLTEAAVEPGSLRSDGSRAYFAAAEEQHGRELWTSDGTPQGTVLVKDINPGFADSAPSSPAVIDGVLLFSADDGIHGRELWRSDGTPAGTYLLDDICPDSCSSLPRGFTKSGPRIYFAADDGETGSELWAMPASAVNAPSARRSPAVLLPRR